MKKIVTGIIALAVVVSLLMAAFNKDTPETKSAHNSGEEAVGVIDITGTIVSGGSGGSGFGQLQSGSQTIINQLQEAADDPSIKAVVLRVNSPGGTAVGSMEIGNQIKRLRQTGKPVVAYMAEVAASGGYWICCEADHIVANPSTMTGSIGVIMETVDLQGLYEKLGIDRNTFKSGPHKDMGSDARHLTDKEREIFQSMVDDIYQQFLDVVVEGRKMEAEQVQELADGRLFTGRQAAELGLVDQLGDMQDAIDAAAQMAGIEQPDVVNLTPRTIWDDLLWPLSAGNILSPQGLDLIKYRLILMLP
ncbi:signal peptide peptidase SppA [Desulfofalx alkaliphila]|uniref:signal peptide peptidase SppA n=1 Tax=Desulfofalx alkaliphila TaxID=105483 RepID=UPI000AC80F16|nr:signal peptide peptidase SppA [Desulfofalx alkaliphila]